ncbi:MAG: hypothetical protein JXR10_04830 [Cyclobacteriaceae bacterium]
MKWLALYILLVSAVGCSMIPSVEVDKNDPGLQKTSKGLLQYQGKLFSGYTITRFENGNISATTAYYEGQKHGRNAGYYSSGELNYERNYHHGEKHGTHRGYYQGGAVRFEYTFNHGENVGTHYEWYEDGSMAMEANYKNGQPFGTQRVWRSDGKLRTNYVIREDGRKYGLVGIKRCKNIDTEEERVKPLTAAVYEK